MDKKYAEAYLPWTRLIYFIILYINLKWIIYLPMHELNSVAMYDMMNGYFIAD